MTQQKKSVKFEEAMQKLQECVERMDAGDVSLEESIDLYEKCAAYHRQCAEILSRAKQRVEIYRSETRTVTEFGEEL